MVKAVRANLDPGSRVAYRDGWAGGEVPSRFAELLEKVWIPLRATHDGDNGITIPGNADILSGTNQGRGCIVVIERPDRPVFEEAF